MLKGKIIFESFLRMRREALGESADRTYGDSA